MLKDVGMRGTKNPRSREGSVETRQVIKDYTSNLIPTCSFKLHVEVLHRAILGIKEM